MKHSYREITRDPFLFWWGAGGCVNSLLKLRHLRPKNGNLFLQVSILHSWFRLLLHKRSQKTVQFLVDGQALVCAVNRMAKIATNSTVGFRTRTVCLTAGEIPLAAKLVVHGAPDGRWNPTRGQTSRQRGPSSIKKPWIHSPSTCWLWDASRYIRLDFRWSLLVSSNELLHMRTTALFYYGDFDCDWAWCGWSASPGKLYTYSEPRRCCRTPVIQWVLRYI